MSDADALPPELLAAFRDRLARDRAALLARGADVFDEAARADLGVIAHKLAGAAGTFGHAAVGRAAEDVERLLAIDPALIAAHRSSWRALVDAALNRLVFSLGEVLDGGAADPRRPL